MNALPRRFRSFALVLVLAFGLMVSAGIAPAAAWAAAEGSQSNADVGATVDGLVAGVIDDSPISKADASGGMATQSKAIPCPYDITEYSGATMYETSVAQAKAAYPGGSEQAIIVGPGDAWVDALSAAGLAASKGPILFSDKADMNKASLKALQELGVKSVVIIGGPDAVGVGVEDDLKDAGIEVETRLGGADCYGTQLEIFNYGLENSLWGGGLVIVATGTWFGDALSASPVAYAEKAPIFLVNDKKELNADQKAAWEKVAAEGFGKDVAAVGGEAVVSKDTVDYIGGLSKKAGGSGEASWLWGETQYETSMNIARWSVKQRGFTWDKCAFTTGLQPYDALAGSVLQGSGKSVMLLADSADAATISKAYDHNGEITNMRFFGGKRALTSNTRLGIADKFRIPYAAIPNFKLYLDAGHGFNDTGSGVFDSGATGNGYQEHDLTVELANKVATILRDKYDMDIFLNDDGGPYWLRHGEAVDEGCDMLVSIHFNAGGGSGSLTLVHSYNNAQMSIPLAEKIHPKLVESMGLYDYGIRGQAVAILGGQLPAALLEICFIDNAHDMDVYQSNKDHVAAKIAEGIVS